MERKYSYSVCMASYNGEKFIGEQIESILLCLSENDELIISDDGSNDDTISIINNYQKVYNNIWLIKGPKKGIACNFGNAILASKKEIIVLTDQDDIWCKEKLNIIDESFSKNANLTTVMHSMTTFRGVECGVDTREITVKYHEGFLKNLLFSCYWGCCMAFKRSFMHKYLPFKDYSNAHDQIIGLLTEKYGNCEFIPVPLIKHRLHDNNQTHSRSFYDKIIFRYNVFMNYLYVVKNVKNEFLK